MEDVEDGLGPSAAGVGRKLEDHTATAVFAVAEVGAAAVFGGAIEIAGRIHDDGVERIPAGAGAVEFDQSLLRPSTVGGGRELLHSATAGAEHRTAVVVAAKPGSGV